MKYIIIVIIIIVIVIIIIIGKIILDKNTGYPSSSFDFIFHNVKFWILFFATF
jgi:hypothetical protein